MNEDILSNEENKYAQAWKSLRWWSFCTIIATICAVFWIIFADILGYNLSRFWNILALAALFFSGARLRGFLCPRCDNSFFIKGNSGGFFIKKCAHCGLPKWTTKNPGADLSEWDKFKLGS